MKLPFPNDLPPAVRRIGRALSGPETRARFAAGLHHAAHVVARRDPLFRNSLAQLLALKNRHQGETCVIIGNGPSIAGCDFRRLSHVPAFCLNRGYLMWKEQKLTPSYLVAVNDLVIEQFHADIAAIACPVFVPWTQRAHFAGSRNTIFLEMRWHKRFFADPRQGIWAGATVTFAAMQLAYFMGFKRVLLIGVDHRFKETGLPHAEVLQKDNDSNHFSPNYFGKDVRWNLPDLEQSEAAYRMAKSAFERDGRQILDCTRGGALAVFGKGDFDVELERLRDGKYGV